MEINAKRMIFLTIKISSPLFSIFSLAAILVGSLDHRTQIWKGAIQGPFHQSLMGAVTKNRNFLNCSLLL
jgi:hypothetical protein